MIKQLEDRVKRRDTALQTARESLEASELDATTLQSIMADEEVVALAVQEDFEVNKFGFLLLAR